ncbi:cellulose-binding protein [Methylocystis parvus]|uniref:Cellulose-binding protein n=1 Tax=Methylocystis parvus TaxID=134 RepID=A0A6B8M448_9HYPH|nr:cellulose-binding protein [Methylocystis parvus]QGM96519.1 cellulose-binding protein [Methylocystis parvus]WBJ99630.1 cellulose-binding protein [Methylocystis parvus OBBP]
MRRAFTLSLGLALAFALVASDALAKSRKAAPAQQPDSGSDEFAIPLPKDLTTNKDWLDDGAGNPASGTLQPNAHANDNYFTQQQQFWRNDPTRNTEAGQLFDGF